jgi:predicted metalloprotease with PDZ domain
VSAALYASALMAAVVMQGPALRYEVAIPDPAAQRFEVSLEIPEPAGDTLQFFMPIWAPGGYQVVNYGRWVRNLRAEDPRGRALRVLREGTPAYPREGAPGDAWKIVTGGARRIVLRYAVEDIEVADAPGLWFELSDITPDEAFFNGTAVFGYPAGRTAAPIEVCYRPPARWVLVVPLESTGVPNCFRARDYDALVDAPVYLGRDVLLREFSEAGRAIRLAVSPVGPYAPDSLLAVVRDVVRAGVDFFGEAPFPHYTFLVELADPFDPAGRERYGDSYGALEHANSSAYLLPQVPEVATRGFFFFPQVLAHEFFHLWSPKRIHSDRLGPFDYQSPVETSTLWFAEGVTDYYAHVWLARYGIVEQWRVLRELAGLVDRLATQPGAYAEPITALSRRLSRTDDVNEILPLYYKGTLLGLLLDVHLRRSTGNRVGLDSVMREMNRRYGRTGRGFPDDSLVAILESLAGVALDEFAAAYLHGTRPFPLEETFRGAGLALVRDTVLEPNLGAAFAIEQSGNLVVAELTGRDGLATLGIRAGDAIAVWDGAPVNAQTVREVFEAFGETYDPERSYTIGVRRGADTTEVRGRIPSRIRLQPDVRPDPGAGPLERAIREAIFGTGESAEG